MRVIVLFRPSQAISAPQRTGTNLSQEIFFFFFLHLSPKIENFCVWACMAFSRNFLIFLKKPKMGQKVGLGTFFRFFKNADFLVLSEFPLVNDLKFADKMASF